MRTDRERQWVMVNMLRNAKGFQVVTWLMDMDGIVWYGGSSVTTHLTVADQKMCRQNTAIDNASLSRLPQHRLFWSGHNLNTPGWPGSSTCSHE
jgi:hypothetical protein